MIPKTAIILWDGIDCSIDNINNNIQALRASKIDNIYCSLVAINDLPRLQCKTIIEPRQIGSFKAIIRALNAFQTEHVDCSQGLIILYGHTYLAQNAISKLLQISTIASCKPSIKGFLTVRATKGQQKTRYNLKQDGLLADAIQASQGNEVCGLFFITPSLLSIIKQCPAEKMSEFITWCITEKHHLYAIINGCCGDPYTI